MDFVGTVLESVCTDGAFKYTIAMEARNSNHEPTIYSKCLESAINCIFIHTQKNNANKASAVPSSFVPSPAPSTYSHDDNSTTTLHDNHQETTSPLSDENLASNEYQYLKNKHKKHINAPTLLKQAKEWNITINKKEDIRQMYNWLKTNFGYYNICLLPWDEIYKDTTSILQITEENCTNYHNARKIMSQTIFDYFENRKETLFGDYTEPQYSLKAFKNDSDGVGFLLHLLTAVHPNLRQLTDYEKIDKPKLITSQDIHDFVSKYLEWLTEENMLNQQQYTNKEKTWTIF